MREIHDGARKDQVDGEKVIKKRGKMEYIGVIRHLMNVSTV
jgi:hypothetical protein